MKSLNTALLSGIVLMFSFFSVNSKPEKSNKVKVVDDSISVALREANQILLKKNVEGAKKVVTEVKMLDSVTEKQKEDIKHLKTENKEQLKEIKSLHKEVDELKTVEPIIIRDTIIVEKKKNFWGSTKIDTIQ